MATLRMPMNTWKWILLVPSLWGFFPFDGGLGDGRAESDPFSRKFPAAADSSVEMPKIELVADNATVPIKNGAAQVSSQAKLLTFLVGDPLNNTINPTGMRVRYKLDGVDPDWNERPGEMALMITCVGEDGRVAGRKIFSIAGQSPGWNGRLEGSPFVETTKTFTVPEGVVRIGVSICSAGPPDSLGVLVVKNLRILRSSPDGSMAPLVDSDSSAKGENPGDPPQWGREGTDPAMAKMLSSRASPPENVFAIFDNDPLGHAEWHLGRDFEPPVTAGETLTVRWKAVYNVGLGFIFSVSYGTLSPGHYKFRVNQVDFFGNALKNERAVDIEVPRPYWSNPWLWLAAGAVVVALIIATVRFIVRSKLRRVHQEHAVERERLRIAQDIHDDLGARLTHISLLSGFGSNQASVPVDQERFERIATMTQDMVSSLYQTIWTVNPEHDSLDSLVTFLCQLIHDLCDPTGIRCRIQSSENFGAHPVTSEVRHNISMAVRESVNNAQKHSGATEIRFSINWKRGKLAVCVADNGHGFDPDAIDRGSGLANIRNRIQKIGGTVSIDSEPDNGTTVSMDIPV